MRSIERSAPDGGNVTSEAYTRDEAASCQEEEAQGQCDDGPAEGIPALRSASSRTAEVFAIPAAYFAFHILLDRRGIVIQVNGRSPQGKLGSFRVIYPFWNPQHLAVLTTRSEGAYSCMPFRASTSVLPTENHQPRRWRQLLRRPFACSRKFPKACTACIREAAEQRIFPALWWWHSSARFSSRESG